MGLSLPPAASIDLVGSFARLRNAEVEIVLAEPEFDHGQDELTLQLSRGRRRVVTVARVVHHDDGRREVVARAPRAELSDGTWSLALATAGADRGEPVEARLLVQGKRPLVLLWGASDKASLVPTKHTRPSQSRQAAAAGGVVLDRILSVLPPERASALRARARSLVRRVMP